MIRVRDLERKYIDLASNLDRRVQTFIEENPQKILRHLRVNNNSYKRIIIVRILKIKKAHFGKKVNKNN